MQRARAKRSWPGMSIMKLPYQTHHELSRILDPDGANDWKKLVSLIRIYTAEDVKMIESKGIKPGMSCTKALLEDMDIRRYNVNDLRDIIKKSGNKKALRCLLEGLDNESLIHKDATTSLKRKRYIRPPLELEEPSDVNTGCKRKVQGMRHKEEKENKKTEVTGTRETLPMHYPSLQPQGDSAPETIETLTMNQPIQQPSRDIGQTHPGAGTRETLTLCNPSPETRRTVRREDAHQYGEVMALHFSIQDTQVRFQKELHKRSHTENLPSENEESQYRDSDGDKASLPCLSTSSCRRMPLEHEDNTQESARTWSQAPLGWLMWMMSCGGLGEAV